jgi:type I restriction enzyme S subunit
MNGGLPKGWVETTFPHVALLNPKSSLDDDTEVAFVPMPHVPTNFSDTLRFEKKLWRDVKRGFTHFRNDDVIFAKITPCFENGKAAIVTGLPNAHGAGSTEFYVLRPVIVPSPLLFYWVKTAAFLKTAEAHMTGTVGQKRVPKTIVESHPLPLPPLNEQKRIVAKLDAIMPRIDAAKERLEKIPAILKRFRQSVLTAAVTGKLTEKWREEHPDVESVEALLEKARGFKKALHQNTCIAEKIAVTQKKKTCFFREEEAEIEGIELPRSWNTTYLGNISWVQGGVQKTPKRKPVNNFYRYLSVANVYRGFLKLDNVSSFEATESEFDQYKLIKGDLLIVEGNGSAGEIGRCAIWSGEIEKCIHQNHIIRARPVSSLLDSSYSMLFFNSNFGIKIMMGIASTTSGLYTLSVSKVNNLPIPLPPLDEQQEIVRQVDKLFALADKVEEHYRKARARVDALAQSVLAKAFRGELVPQDPGDEPAEKLLQRIREEKAKMETELKTASRRARGTRKKGAKTQRAGAEEMQASEP